MTIDIGKIKTMDSGTLLLAIVAAGYPITIETEDEYSEKTQTMVPTGFAVRIGGTFNGLNNHYAKTLKRCLQLALLALSEVERCPCCHQPLEGK